MTLHCWMHWFWITSSAVVFIALHLVQPSVGAPTLRSYTLSTEAEILGQQETHHGSTITEPHHMQTLYSKSLWDSSTVSSIDESNTVLWQSDTISIVSDTGRKKPLDSNGRDISQYSTSTYLPLVTEKTGLSGEVTPFLTYKSRSPDSTSTNSRHMFLYPTAIEEHSFSSIPSTDNSEFSDAETGAVHAAEKVVPVTELTYIYKTESEKVLPIERTTMSIKSVPNSSLSEDSSSVVIPQKDISSSASTSSNSSDISLHPLFQPFNSDSQGMDKPVVNIPRLITRDLKNNSEAYPSTSSSVSILASHDLSRESPDIALPLPLPQLNPPNIRTGKAANYIPPQPFVVHPLVVLTTLPTQTNPRTFPFPNSDTSDTMHGFVQGYHQGPNSGVHGGSAIFKDIPVSKSERHEESDVKIWADNTPENPSHHVGESMIKEKSDLEPEGGDSRITWIKKVSPNFDAETQRGETVLKAEVKTGDTGRNPLEDKEMGDSPYIPPEIATTRNSEDTDSKSPPIHSSDFILPSDRVTSESDMKPLDPSRKTHGTEIMKVIPPMMNSSKIMNISSRSGGTPDNGTRSSHSPPVVSGNADSNTSVQVSAENTDSSTIISATGGKLADTNSSVLTVPSSLSGAKQVANITSPVSDLEENETTVITVVPTIVPISNAGRVAAPAPSGSRHGLDAASITGISLGILVFAALVGAVSFVLYRRRFLNKPQTLNDKCSNPDSSGYIDDSTLRENSEEMYSLDNDSFLNSLEAMTIQNYWTDNVKHTKL